MHTKEGTESEILHPFQVAPFLSLVMKDRSETERFGRVAVIASGKYSGLRQFVAIATL